MLTVKYCFFRWSRILVLPNHKLIIAFLKQYKEAECNCPETATVFKDYYMKENTNSEVKHLGLKVTKISPSKWCSDWNILGRFVRAKLTKYTALPALFCIINYLINQTIDSLLYWLIVAFILSFCFLFCCQIYQFNCTTFSLSDSFPNQLSHSLMSLFLTQFTAQLHPKPSPAWSSWHAWQVVGPLGVQTMGSVWCFGR